MSCFYINFCPSNYRCNGKIDDFCINEYDCCARYFVGCCLGITEIPDDLLPNEHTRIKDILKDKIKINKSIKF